MAYLPCSVELPVLFATRPLVSVSAALRICRVGYPAEAIASLFDNVPWSTWWMADASRVLQVSVCTSTTVIAAKRRHHAELCDSR
jgi:hypothetical protein